MVMDLNNKKKYNNKSFSLIVICKELDKLINIYDFTGKCDLLTRGIITKLFFYQYICNCVYDMSKKDINIDKRIIIYEKITSLVFKLNQLDN